MSKEIYNLAVTFDVPMEGVVTIAANDENDAKEVLTKMFKHRKNVEIIDCYNVKDAPGIEEFMETDDSGKPVTLN